jgi:hypothetical protein
MKTIFYLCHSDEPGTIGLLFPGELLKGTYSPGLWFIELRNLENLPDEIEFDAVDNNDLLTLKLVRIDSSVYQVETGKHGRFYFRIMDIPYLNYVGRSKLINKNSMLYQVVSLDIEKLQKSCLSNDFFFVGRVDTELIQRII